MKYHIFNEENGEFLRSVEYFDSRKPSGKFWTAEKDLKVIQNIENGILVMIEPDKKRIEYLTPKEFTEHKITLKLVELSDRQKVQDDGLIVSKSRAELIAEGIITKEILLAEKKSLIGQEADHFITTGFASNANGKNYIYDSTLTDQFNIKSIADMNIDAPIRCKDVATGVKTFVPHKKEAIRAVVENFGFFVTSILMKADTMKLELDALTSASEIENYIINWS